MNNDSSLLELLNCNISNEDTFLYDGENPDLGFGHIFGGQVLAQSVLAAQSTVDANRTVHSAHAYFLRIGDLEAPITFNVDRTRDGNSYSSRRVIASQNDAEIFHMSASFQVQRPEVEYYEDFVMPNRIPDDDVEKNADLQPQFFDSVVIEPEGRSSQDALQIWFRVKQPLPKEPSIQRAALAYISDMGILASVFVPLVEDYTRDIRKTLVNHKMATLDHAVWFHRDFDLNEWFLYNCTVESISDSRGFCRGRFYTKEGVLIASATQEGMLRKRRS